MEHVCEELHDRRTLWIIRRKGNSEFEDGIGVVACVPGDQSICISTHVRGNLSRPITRVDWDELRVLGVSLNASVWRTLVNEEYDVPD